MPSTCSTCNGTGTVRCLAHVADDGCDNLAIVCPDCAVRSKETAYLMSNPANARRLNEAIEQLRSGDGTIRELSTGATSEAENRG